MRRTLFACLDIKDLIQSTMDYPVKELERFRAQMGLELSEKDKRRIFEGLGGYENTAETEYKLGMAREAVEDLLVSDWVKFIGVTGSVASGGVVMGDDIDVFIVVKNDRAWVYRLVIWFRDLFRNQKLKRVDKSARDRNSTTHMEWQVKDKICMNFICEERALRFDQDIFTFHELSYMRPVYNPQFLFTIFSENKWMTEFGAYRPTVFSDPPRRRRSNFRIFLNDMAFLGQLMFMTVASHNPEYKRLIHNHNIGRITFYPKDFKEEILNELKKSR